MPILKKRSTALKVSFFLIGSAALFLTVPIWAPWPGTVLLVKDGLAKADCIVPLQGDAYYRFGKAAELLKKGYSGRIVVSVTPEREEELREYYYFHERVRGLEDIPFKEQALLEFEYFGLDREKVLFTELEVTSTYDEAVATRKLLEERGFHSLILVTNGYHMRRALWLFRWVFRDSGIKIYPVSALHPLYDPGHWWCHERDVKALVAEYISLLQNFLYHAVLKKNRTSFDTF